MYCQILVAVFISCYRCSVTMAEINPWIGSSNKILVSWFDEIINSNSSPSPLALQVVVVAELLYPPNLTSTPVAKGAPLVPGPQPQLNPKLNGDDQCQPQVTER